VYISHKLDELFEIAGRYAVLRDGRKVGEGIMKETSSEELIRMMVGRDLGSGARSEEREKGEEVLRVEHLSFQDPEHKGKYLVQDAGFTLHKGEVLGMAGLMGAGRSELLEAIFGLHPGYVSGEIYIDNKLVQIRTVSDAIACGIALVPEDRKLQGLILTMDVTKNMSLASLDRMVSYGFISTKREEELGRHYTKDLSIKLASRHMEVQKLSGGNQQKVVIAKWLATRPKILLLDEPTRGIDVGAKAEIYQLIREMVARGMGIIVVSSELPEILLLSDHILVLSESKLTGSFTRSEASEEKIMHAALQEKE
jgi:ribose transport system ATP-binding protein